MKSKNFGNKIGRILLALSFIAGIGLVSSTAVQAQRDRDRRDQDQDYQRNQDRNYRRDRDRNRDNRRDRDYDRNRDNRRNDQYGRNGGYGNGGYGNGGYGNGGYGGYGGYNQVAMNQGYQDGLYTGSNDAQRGQNYDPQRSHFYRNGHGNNGNYGNNGRYGNGSGSSQTYRQGFLRGYDEGFRRYGGNRRNNGNYSRRWPF